MTEPYHSGDIIVEVTEPSLKGMTALWKFPREIPERPWQVQTTGSQCSIETFCDRVRVGVLNSLFGGITLQKSPKPELDELGYLVGVGLTE